MQEQFRLKNKIDLQARDTGLLRNQASAPSWKRQLRVVKAHGARYAAGLLCRLL